jgi:hypothetical protein
MSVGENWESVFCSIIPESLFIPDEPMLMVQPVSETEESKTAAPMALKRNVEIFTIFLTRFSTIHNLLPKPENWL